MRRRTPIPVPADDRTPDALTEEIPDAALEPRRPFTFPTLPRAPDAVREGDGAGGAGADSGGTDTGGSGTGRADADAPVD